MPNDCVAVHCTPKARKEYTERTGNSISYHRLVGAFKQEFETLKLINKSPFFGRFGHRGKD